MNEKQIGLLVISPMIVGTAILMWRLGVIGLKQVALIALAVGSVAGFLFFNF
ncbi:MAG: hypothetical protein HY055_09845 [Magnetospirillum sp.]|nr:hypothetical protein [Magnetospirillum sp.]